MKNYSIDQKMLLFLAASIVLPFPITLVAIITTAMYFICYKDVKSIIKNSKQNKLLLIIPIFTLIVSIFQINVSGMAVSIILFMLFMDAIYFKEYVDNKFFVKIVEMIILLSLLGVFVATIEQFHFLNTIKEMNNFFDIQNKPSERVKAFYFNANYFAMILVFIENLCVYRFMKNSNIKKRVYYFIVGCLNLYAMYLTGGRIAFLALAISTLVMLFVGKWYKTFGIIMVLCFLAIGIVALHPHLIPRLSSQGVKVARRSLIWKTGSMMVKDNLIFGLGPFGYFTFWGAYLNKFKVQYGLSLLHKYKKLGINSQHAHTMLLEPIISFGLIGTIMFLIYFASVIKQWILVTKNNKDYETRSLIFGMMITTISFCIVDFPIMWIQTGLMLMLFINGVNMYKGE